MNYIPGAVVSTEALDGGRAEGSTGFARYSDEAYKAVGRLAARTPALPPFPPRARRGSPCKGRNKLRWYRGISALYPSDG